MSSMLASMGLTLVGSKLTNGITFYVESSSSTQLGYIVISYCTQVWLKGQNNQNIKFWELNNARNEKAEFWQKKETGKTRQPNKTQ